MGLSVEGRIFRAASGHLSGMSHPRAQHSDAIVERAREMREGGSSYQAIGRAVGAHWRTVADWVNYRTR